MGILEGDWATLGHLPSMLSSFLFLFSVPLFSSSFQFLFSVPLFCSSFLFLFSVPRFSSSFLQEVRLAKSLLDHAIQ